MMKYIYMNFNMEMTGIDREMNGRHRQVRSKMGSNPKAETPKAVTLLRIHVDDFAQGQYKACVFRKSA